MKTILTFLTLLPAIASYAGQLSGQNAGLFNSDTARIKKTQNTNPSIPGKRAAESMANAAFAAPVSVQILIGSQGVGADLKYGFLPKLSGRAGFGLVPVTVNNIFGFSSFSTDNQLSAKFTNVHLLAEYAPFNSGRFRIVGGAAYIVKGDASLIVTPKGNYQFGNTTITKDEIGVLNAEVSWKGMAPYLGAALFKSFPNRLFNINADIGTYYLSSPGTSFTGTKMLSDNSSQQPQFNKNMQGYHWLPVLQLNFNFRIK